MLLTDGGIQCTPLASWPPKQALWPGEIQRMPAWSFSGSQSVTSGTCPRSQGRTVCSSAGTCGSGICVTVRGCHISSPLTHRACSSYTVVFPRPAHKQTQAQSCNEAAAQ
ncbi:hypothetical protein CI102_15270 [Trichoderma harzianum]|nr:hypothetical protein CI102_15270 [Trichoderma harzianum]